MEHRNLKRFFMTAKVLRKHNKTALFEITSKRLSYLLLIHYMQAFGSRRSLANIIRENNKFGNSDGWKNANNTLYKMSQAGLIEKTDGQYTLTISGISTLNTLESMLRKERFDR